MSTLKKLQTATSLRGIAALLKVEPKVLSNQLYKKAKGSLYTQFRIPKRHGGYREIFAPEAHLKLLQYRLSNLLQDCLTEINKELPNNRLQSGIAHGFMRERSIMTNGRAHVSRRYVFNIDLHDFFGTINFGRVRGFFLKNKNFQLSAEAATVLAQIACYDNKLPQGSPCSPVISNLIAHHMDILLARLAATEGVTYTRYADDLTFSTNKKSFPQGIAICAGGHVWAPGKKLQKLVTRCGFSINPNKTRMQYCDSRQEVTGLTVNRKVNVSAAYRNTVRAMVDRLFKTGGFELQRSEIDTHGNSTVKTFAGTRDQLHGMLAYIDRVDVFNNRLREENSQPPFDTPGRTALYRRFIYFDKFYAPPVPMIVCEGKTDNIYLRCAIHSLAAKYPQLAEVSKGSAPKLAIRFYRHTERRINDITDLGGGVNGICKLIKNYNDDLQRWFKAPAPKHPTIIVIDNDAGSHSVYEVIAGVTKRKKPEGMADFIHVVVNLYVVPTPFGPGKKPSDIEDLFDDATLETVLDGKTFNKADKADKKKHYGKAIFASGVVEKNAKTIDFSKFTVLLDRIVKAMDDYKSKTSGV